MSFLFNQENLNKIESLKIKYPDSKALSLPLLWMVQYQEGFISIDAMQEIAKLSGHHLMEIYKVATFYTMFNLEPIGKHHIQVCKTLSCSLCGKREVIEAIKKYLQIEIGETTADKMFTLSQVECLGSCGTAPVMQINDVFYENLTPHSVITILKELQ
jgi:NADH-quinone oxidoreductase subunit E